MSGGLAARPGSPPSPRPRTGGFRSRAQSCATVTTSSSVVFPSLRKAGPAHEAVPAPGAPSASCLRGHRTRRGHGLTRRRHGRGRWAWGFLGAMPEPPPLHCRAVIRRTDLPPIAVRASVRGPGAVSIVWPWWPQLPRPQEGESGRRSCPTLSLGAAAGPTSRLTPEAPFANWPRRETMPSGFSKALSAPSKAGAGRPEPGSLTLGW